MTRIRTDGPNGNTLFMLGQATDLMRQLGVAPEEIDKLTKKVFAAKSYRGARQAIREWFPLDTDGY